jgi:hypothetical protein
MRLLTGAEYVACVVLYGKSWYPGNDSGDTVSAPNVRPEPIQSLPAWRQPFPPSFRLDPPQRRW